MTMTEQKKDIHNFQGWIADLSDGTTTFEGQPVAGEPSPWQKFLQHLRDNPTYLRKAEEGPKPLFITRLRLQRHNVTLMSMPHKMVDGYFHAYEVEQLVYRNITVFKQGIGSIKGGTVFINWIARDVNPEVGMVYMWQDERPLDSCKVHTTLSEVSDDK